MPFDRTILYAYFAEVGINRDAVGLYLTLVDQGPQSISALARLAGIERTKAYRLLDTLTDAQIVEVELHNNRRVIKAAPVTNLHILLSRREQVIKNMQQQLDDIDHRLEYHGIGHSSTYIQFYKGNEGLKQLNWNQTKATTESLSILPDNMQSKTGVAFFNRWANRANERGIHFRSIIDDKFTAVHRQWLGQKSQHLLHWHARYMPSDVFRITHHMVIYNNVTVYYQWNQGEVFGLEIYNQQIADTQRHFFETLWQKAIPISESLYPSDDGPYTTPGQ